MKCGTFSRITLASQHFLPHCVTRTSFIHACLPIMRLHLHPCSYPSFMFHFISRGPTEDPSLVTWYAGVVQGIEGVRTGLRWGKVLECGKGSVYHCKQVHLLIQHSPSLFWKIQSSPYLLIKQTICVSTKHLQPLSPSRSLSTAARLLLCYSLFFRKAVIIKY